MPMEKIAGFRTENHGPITLPLNNYVRHFSLTFDIHVLIKLFRSQEAKTLYKSLTYSSDIKHPVNLLEILVFPML